MSVASGYNFFEDFSLLVKWYDANEYIFGFAIIAVCLILIYVYNILGCNYQPINCEVNFSFVHIYLSIYYFIWLSIYYLYLYI